MRLLIALQFLIGVGRGYHGDGVKGCGVKGDHAQHQKNEHGLGERKLPQDIQEWYEGELQRRHEQLREHLDTPKESFYRTELESFRSMFHKPVIYATWDWSSTVEDALHQASFASFEEQAAALEEYRKIKF